MNFQATNYLGDLNLDLDGVMGSSLNESTGTSSNDLDLFSQSEFFDLDVFSNNHIVPNKPQANHYLFTQEQPVIATSPEQEQHPAVKQEQTNSWSPISIDESTNETKYLIDASNEDKRKRNTAASARFRIKKKMKEQQMEQRAKELQDKVSSLEKKLKTLEMENKCLKNLILVKNEQKNSELLEDIKKKSIIDTSSDFSFTS